MTKNNPHRGSTLNEFLEAEGFRDELEAVAAKEVLVWQIEQAMKASQITQAAMAERLDTSRAQVARILDPQNESITLATIQKVAAAIGKRLRIELVDA